MLVHTVVPNVVNDRVGRVPVDTDPFVGRDAELTRLEALHAGARLLTVLGPPGIGKTRLARRFAARVDRHYRDGVWYIDLASVIEADLLPHAVAHVLDARAEPGQSATDALVSYLWDREALLVLDTCESMLGACATLACALADNCARLRVLAVSREALDTSGDTIWRTPPLSVPAVAAGLSEVALAESVQLLLVRARQHGNRFTLTRANFARIAELCREVGGLPLALELVAARLSTRAIPQIPTDVVVQPGDRERVMHRVLDWAHDQLTERQKILFRRLSVFAGRWDEAAACSVCRGEGLPAGAIPSALEGLIKASLVMQDSANCGTRYRLLDVVHGYALDKLRAAGAEAVQRTRFAAHILALAERVAPEELNSEHASLLEREIDNLRAALAWTIGTGDAESALRLATAASSLWYFRGYYAEGAEWLERGLRLSGATTLRTRARAAAWLGQLLQFRAEYGSAEQWLQIAVDLHTANDDSVGGAVANAMLCQLILVRGDVARAYMQCNEAADRLERLGLPLHVASKLQVAVAAIELGDLERAATVVGECKSRDVDPDGALGAWLRFLEGRLAAASRNFALAHTYLTQALEASRTSHEQTAVITALIELGNVELELNAMPAARKAFAEAIELARRSGERVQLARALEGIGCSLSLDQPALAVRLVSAAARLRSLMGIRAWPLDRRRIAAWLPRARQALVSADSRGAWKEGQSTNAEQAVALVRMLSARSHSAATSTPSFTPRERQIISLLARALTNEQIAMQLAIRPATARTHVERVMLKIGLHRRAELVLWAIQHDAEMTSPRR